MRGCFFISRPPKTTRSAGQRKMLPYGSESVLQLTLYSLAHRFDERRDYRSNHWRWFGDCRLFLRRGLLCSRLCHYFGSRLFGCSFFGGRFFCYRFFSSGLLSSRFFCYCFFSSGLLSYCFFSSGLLCCWLLSRCFFSGRFCCWFFSSGLLCCWLLSDCFCCWFLCYRLFCSWFRCRFLSCCHDQLLSMVGPNCLISRTARLCRTTKESVRTND